MPTECTPDFFGFEPVEGREVVAAFDAGSITSDAGALLLGATDRAINRIVWHIAGLGVRDSFAQSCIRVRVAAAGARRDRDLFNQLGEKLAALGVERAFLVFDGVPLGMSGHL